jgi:hypothetical protein
MSRHALNYGRIELLHRVDATYAQVLSLESRALQQCEKAHVGDRIEGHTELLVDTSETISTIQSLAIDDAVINIAPYSRAQNRKWFDRARDAAPLPFVHELIAAPHLFTNGPTKSLNARDCKVGIVDSRASRAFYNQSHIQGAPQSLGTNYGLFHDDLLVMMLTICASRANRNKNTMEILRMATLPSYRVRGGASKLFSATIKDLQPGTVVESYNDDRLFSGAIYSTLGMTPSHISQPDYFWIKGDQVLRRSATRRSNLPSLLGDQFDPSQSEAVNMTKAGWTRIWGSGHTLYTYTVGFTDADPVTQPTQPSQT